MSKEIRDSRELREPKEQKEGREASLNLEINGRLFPSWLLLNFKNYEIPEILRKEGDDPCNEKLVKDIL
jgi:hypothetical protein